MFGQYNNIKVKGIVTAVPSYVESNERYVEILGEKRVKKQTRMTGVLQRRINDSNQHAADLCIVAAKKLLEQISWKREDIKVVVFIFDCKTNSFLSLIVSLTLFPSSSTKERHQ